MAIRKVYIGSIGPYLFDDTDPIDDPDGDFAGESFGSVVTSGKFRQKESATGDDDLVRKADLDGRTITTEDDTTEVVTNVTYTTETKTVVTGVDFATETVTTETITYVKDITVTTENITYLTNALWG